jgi:hypothetical protein
MIHLRRRRGRGGFDGGEDRGNAAGADDGRSMGFNPRHREQSHMPMRELRACDFCGTDAVGVYEVLPPELSPAEGEQRRVSLCADCHETLETVVDPLLDRLGVESGAEDAADGTGVPAASARAEPDPGAVVADEEPAADGPDPEAAERTADGVDDPVADRGDDARNDRDRDGRADDAESATEGGDDEAATDADAGESVARGADDVGEEPDQFRTVMRLLGNREFPVDRAEVEDLAAGAYDLDAAHVRDIVDHAVARDLVVDDGGTLRKP